MQTLSNRRGRKGAITAKIQMEYTKEEKGGEKAQMRRIVLDMKGGLLAEAVMQSLSGCDPDFLVYRSSKPEETLALCRTCRANVQLLLYY